MLNYFTITLINKGLLFLDNMCFDKFKKCDACFKNNQAGDIPLTFTVSFNQPRVKLKKIDIFFLIKPKR